MVPSPRHAWTLRSLLCGKPINGELEELLPPFQAIGHRLATLRLEDRQAAWEAFLDGQVDRDGIIQAVAETDPEGPAPEPPREPGSTARNGQRGEPVEPDLPILPEGTRVKVLDRGNFGFVAADLGNRVAVHFTSTDGKEATPVLPKSLLCWPDGQPLTKAPNAQPGGSIVEAVIDGRFATLADIARVVSDQQPLWPGWINRGVLNAVAAEPGTGKTRFALDLARRLYLKVPWPDGQANELPEGTRTLWVQADRAFHEMLEAARAFGLPDEAVALGSSPDDPTGSLDLDDPDTLAALAERIKNVEPALVVIDTVLMTTSRNLCRSEDARAFFGSLMDLAASSGVALLGLTHLSKDKEALGDGSSRRPAWSSR